MASAEASFEEELNCTVFLFFVIAIANSSIDQPFSSLADLLDNTKLKGCVFCCVLFQLQCIEVVSPFVRERETKTSKEPGWSERASLNRSRNMWLLLRIHVGC